MDRPYPEAGGPDWGRGGHREIPRGRLVSLYYHFGEFDGTAIIEAPDDLTANAAVFAVVSSGALRATKTTRLYSAKDFVDSLGKAAKANYRPPGLS